MNNVMLDLETLDTASTAAILQIGACYFNPMTGEVGRTFEVNVDLELSITEGFTVGGSTVYWWLNQRKEAQQSFLAAPRVSPQKAASDCASFLKEAKCIWCHTSFDIPILQNYMRLLHTPYRFNYTKAMDIRTIKNLANIDLGDYDSVGTAHTALDDCRFQIHYVVDALESLDSP